MSCLTSDNEILIIPDIHGLDFWKKPCESWNGIIIFLGDYVDPYPPTTQEEALENLKALVEFAKTTKNTCRFLLGNHDYSYLAGFAPCRFDYNNAEEIKNLLLSLNLCLCTIIKGDREILFSNAGITHQWLNGKDYLDKEFIAPNGFEAIPDMLMQVPYSRGGRDKYGSCIWNSLEDFNYEVDTDKIPAYQIFGHTWRGRTEPIIAKDFAMLDCHKAFILNVVTREIKEYNIK